MALGPLISAVWFPPHQRTTSTALASLSSYVGTGMAFIVGPLLVPDVGNHSRTIGKSIDYIKLRNNMSHNQLNFLKEKIMHLMYLELGAAVLILLVIVVYFPKKPPLPPSLTATIDRLDFKYGLKCLMFNKQFWLLLFINGITLGVYSGWSSILDLNLSQFGLGEKTAGWLGFGASVSGIVAGITLSRSVHIYQCELENYSYLWFRLSCRERKSATYETNKPYTTADCFQQTSKLFWK